MTSRTFTLELLLSGTWTAVPLYSEGGGSLITRGMDPWGSWPRPTEVTTQIANPTLAYDPSRPASLLYGLAGRNTQSRFTSEGNIRVVVEATTWKPQATPEHVPGVKGMAWVDLTAHGLLDRLRTWQEPVRSPMYRTISARSTCIGHWPLEDDKDAVRATATIGQPAITRGIVFAEDDAPQGAKSSARLSDTSFLNGRFNSASTTAGWQIAFSLKLDALPTSSTYVDFFSWRCANGYSWYWSVNNNSYQQRVDDRDGNNLLTSIGVLFGADANPDQWVTFRLKASQVGSLVQLEPAWYSQNGTVWGTTLTFTGAVSVPQQWYQFGSSTVNGGHLSHVFAVTGLTDDLLSASAQLSFDGYNGETTYARYLRIMSEAGLARFVIGGNADAQKMGPQPVASVLEILGEIRDTDGGRIDDERFNVATTMTMRRQLYNQTPAVTLDYAAGQVAIPFNKIIDATPIKNSVTVKNRNGGEVTAELLSGLASVQPPPAGVGAIPYTQNVNVYDEDAQLGDLSTFWLAQLTQGAPRFEEVTIDLLKNPSLVSPVMVAREGNLVRVLNYQYDPIDLLIVGIKEQIGPGAIWTVTFQTEPGEFWRIGVWDDGVWRWDMRTMTIAAGGVTAGATAIPVQVTDPNDVLTTNAASFPMDLVIGQGDGTGEVIRVSSATAAGAGPTYAQTLTATRAINGVSRAWPAGFSVNVHDYRRWGL